MELENATKYSPHTKHIYEHDDGGCAFLQAHPDVVEAVQAEVPSEDEQIDLAELFRMFGDPTRIRILHALGVSELCVGDLSTLVGMSLSAVSHQLRLLRAAELVTSRRDGKAVLYSLSDDHVRTILNMGIEHIREL